MVFEQGGVKNPRPLTCQATMSRNTGNAANSTTESLFLKHGSPKHLDYTYRCRKPMDGPAPAAPTRWMSVDSDGGGEWSCTLARGRSQRPAAAAASRDHIVEDAGASEAPTPPFPTRLFLNSAPWARRIKAIWPMRTWLGTLTGDHPIRLNTASCWGSGCNLKLWNAGQCQYTCWVLGQTAPPQLGQKSLKPGPPSWWWASVVSPPHTTAIWSAVAVWV